MSSEKTQKFLATHWVGLSMLGWFILMAASSAMFVDHLVRASR